MSGIFDIPEWLSTEARTKVETMAALSGQMDLAYARACKREGGEAVGWYLHRNGEKNEALRGFESAMSSIAHIQGEAILALWRTERARIDNNPMTSTQEGNTP